jgi:hypothetical protein
VLNWGFVLQKDKAPKRVTNIRTSRAPSRAPDRHLQITAQQFGGWRVVLQSRGVKAPVCVALCSYVRGHANEGAKRTVIGFPLPPEHMRDRKTVAAGGAQGILFRCRHSPSR